MRKARIRFFGTAGELRNIVRETGTHGWWSDYPEQWRFEASTGAILHWWPSTGTIHCDGDSAAARKLSLAVVSLMRESR